MVRLAPPMEAVVLFAALFAEIAVRVVQVVPVALYQAPRARQPGLAPASWRVRRMQILEHQSFVAAFAGSMEEFVQTLD